MPRIDHDPLQKIYYMSKSDIQKNFPELAAKLDVLDLFLIEKDCNCRINPNKIEKLEEAIMALDQTEKLVLTYLYGLFGTPAESAHEIIRKRVVVNNNGEVFSEPGIRVIRQRALLKLIDALGNTFFENINR